ncbi:MAG: EVE domain-containing protein, partial [Gammaproteobacteria bacterium]|nr:EVE domain-containing protein [Gammaproteobacteria bacterium]
LTELKQHPQLSSMPLLRRGNRLSIMPVTPEQWRFILDRE